jgi:hypothetical protein
MEISRIPMFPHEMLSASDAAAARVIAAFAAMNRSSRPGLKMTCRKAKTDRMARQNAAKSQGSIMWYSSVSRIVFILPLNTTAPIIKFFPAGVLRCLPAIFIPGEQTIREDAPVFSGEDPAVLV